MELMANLFSLFAFVLLRDGIHKFFGHGCCFCRIKVLKIIL